MAPGTRMARGFHGGSCSNMQRRVSVILETRTVCSSGGWLVKNWLTRGRPLRLLRRLMYRFRFSLRVRYHSVVGHCLLSRVGHRGSTTFEDHASSLLGSVAVAASVMLSCIVQRFSLKGTPTLRSALSFKKVRKFLDPGLLLSARHVAMAADGLFDDYPCAGHC